MTESTHAYRRHLHFVGCCSAALLCAGCGSAVERISSGAQEVQSSATSIRTSTATLLDLSARAHSDFQDIATALNPSSGVVTEPAALVRKATEGMDLMQQITALAHTIDADASTIHDATVTILTAVPGVQDRVPWWASLLKQWGYIIAAVGVVALGFYFGIWPVIARFLAVGLGWTHLLPRATVTSATLDAKALALPTVDAPQEAAVASRRTASKDYDAAFRAAQKKLQPTVLPKRPTAVTTPTPSSAQEPPHG